MRVFAQGRAKGVDGSGSLHINIEAGVGEAVERLLNRKKPAMIFEHRPQVACRDAIHGARIAREALKRLVMEQHHVAVCCHLAIGLDVFDSGSVCCCKSGGRVLPHAGAFAHRGNETAVGENSGITRSRKKRVGHAPGGVLGGVWSGFGVNADPMPLRASVSSLGMIQSLLEWPSLIFGSICRYW